MTTAACPAKTLYKIVVSKHGMCHDNVHLLRFDGGSRGNPGMVGYGSVVYAPCTRAKIAELGGFEQHGTNNYAEYKGLLMGLQWCIDNNITTLVIEGDSNLVVQQVCGSWKANGMKHMHSQVCDLVKKFQYMAIGHIYRKDNSDADGLANEAMDKKTSIKRTSQKEEPWSFMGHINFII
jgi:ribonuclease H / adenosylcobalamin/alpha-ribazole phosphatase